MLVARRRLTRTAKDVLRLHGFVEDDIATSSLFQKRGFDLRTLIYRPIDAFRGMKAETSAVLYSISASTMTTVFLDICLRCIVYNQMTHIAAFTDARRSSSGLPWLEFEHHDGMYWNW